MWQILSQKTVLISQKNYGNRRESGITKIMTLYIQISLKVELKF